MSSNYAQAMCTRWLATGLWFSPGTTVSSTNKTDRHDIAEMLLKVVLNTISISSELRLGTKHYDKWVEFNNLISKVWLFFHLFQNLQLLWGFPWSRVLLTRMIMDHGFIVVNWNHHFESFTIDINTYLLIYSLSQIITNVLCIS